MVYLPGKQCIYNIKNPLKLKVMRKVVSKSEVAHFWANQTQDEARTPTGNLYFDGVTIYSYSRHFAIARHVGNSNGDTAVLFNQTNYSVTTSEQQRIVRGAISHKDIVYCYDPTGSTDENFNVWKREIKALAGKLSTCRKPAKYLDPIASLYAQVVRYAEFMQVSVPLDLIAYGTIQNAAEYQAANLNEVKLLNEQRLAAAEIQRLNNIKRLADFKVKLAKWRKFDPKQPMIYRDTNRDYLRFNAAKNRIETSQRVEVPAEIARRFYAQVLQIVANGGCNNCNIKFMDLYNVEAINKDFIKVGCHTIDIKEIKALTKKLGW